MKRIVLLFVIAVAGCANLKFQWSASYQTDNLIADIEHVKQKEEK